MGHNNNIPQTDIGLTQDPENQNIDVSDTMLSGPRTAITKISCEHVLDIIVMRVTAPGELLCTVHLS